MGRVGSSSSYRPMQTPPMGNFIMEMPGLRMFRRFVLLLFSTTCAQPNQVVGFILGHLRFHELRKSLLLLNVCGGLVTHHPSALSLLG